jgi:gas vesicle protein
VYYEKESGSLNFVAGLAMGAVLGASIALLTAPQSGRRTRRHLVRAVEDVRDNADDGWDEVATRARRAVRHGRHAARRGRRRLRR